MKAIMCDGMEPVHIDKASAQINLNSSLGAFTNYVDKILPISTDNLSNPCVHLWRNGFTEIREIYILLTFLVPPTYHLVLLT